MIHTLLMLPCWLVISVILMSFIEHQVHRNMMHRKNVLFFIPAVKRVFNSHAVMHHGHYSKIFADEALGPGEDKGIRLNLREGFFEALPFCAVLAIFSWPCAITFLFVALTHHYIWNQIHLEMHQPVEKPFTRTRIYQFLARHHYLHHKHPDKNFNVVFPFADYVLRTNVKKPTVADIEGMREEGLLPALVQRQLVSSKK
jgi:hypothetical protein